MNEKYTGSGVMESACIENFGEGLTSKLDYTVWMKIAGLTILNTF